ncbi:hypothetical protein EPUL_003417 [Erysiphe pulchra]|uniref:Uncharacterized protein n=1 Tax=Erysiphe pulchra TaxID=225359 RepID=A0A2S4PQI3_9PEZI|nr:hypothetical protein EPUL_003417 [Erysiphe pulchra]
MPIVDLFISWILLSYVVSTHTVLDRRELKENGYNCGDAFFTDQMVHDALMHVVSDQGRKEILPYSGPLYSQFTHYVTWPILPMGLRLGPTEYLWHKSTYQIVFDRNGIIIDLIVRLANNQFAKCWRVESQRSEASIYSVEGSNGYKCGSEFIPDITIAKCVSFAGKYLGGDNYYPLKYEGELYSEDLGYEIWPIYYRHLKIHRYPNSQGGPFFIVIDSNGQLKDVIARTSKKNYIRCMRARKVHPAPSTDELSRVFAIPPRHGYVCKGIFFDNQKLQLASQLAQKTGATKRLKKFPKFYEGAPFNSPCLLWPIKTNGESYRTGGASKYRLVLTLDFQIKCVAMVSDEKIVPCESTSISGGYQDYNSYRCFFDVFSHEELASAAEIACNKMVQPQKLAYPTPYQGFKFDIEGPYLIYPIKKNRFTFYSGQHRLVINTVCQIAGVLTVDPKTREFIKCSVERPEVW